MTLEKAMTAEEILSRLQESGDRNEIDKFAAECRAAIEAYALGDGYAASAEDILTLLRHYEKGTKKGTPLMLGEVANSISLMLLEDTSVSELLALTPEVFAGRIHDISAEDLANTLEQLK
jgi:hypothetical protein